MENQTLIELIEALKDAGLIHSDADFCRKTGFGRSCVSEMKSGKKPFTGKSRKIVEDAFPEFFNKVEDEEDGRGDISRLVDVIVEQNDTIKAMAATKDEQIASLLSIVEAMTGAEKKAAAS